METIFSNKVSMVLFIYSVARPLSENRSNLIVPYIIIFARITSQNEKNMGFIKEFKEFAVKGNVIDLAVGVVIGAAFGKIVGSLVDDIITPAILTPAMKAANLTDLSKLTIPGTAIKYGNFISQVIGFIVVALVLFMVIKAINSMKKKEDEAPAAPVATNEEVLLTEIRDLLKKQA